ncbi:PilZ domain-containing protein [Guyparkeria sp.]|uniref:PilZ domain-containing protein n=1 Tax=Guyparkeria sp. TaxID=2035736 RepID=UPI0035654EE5
MTTRRTRQGGQDEHPRDRRDFARLTNSGMALLRIQGEDLPVGSGRIEDISANGLNLFCNADWAGRIEIGMRVDVVARLDEMTEPFYLAGEVAWQGPVDDGQTQLGIELLPPNHPADKDQPNDNRDWRALFLA